MHGGWVSRNTPINSVSVPILWGGGGGGGGGLDH